ncbi:2-hydroxyacid dehydrogenase [Asticcacaulis excentricus]|uniref:D-isomer specific 2-hydroxyacid dehydrogenase NAD-binding protein n=1 Tax=Asticcacaulis excentricus (strain ATCC 15261 / DSM 4724 / KCTC 12464 / NCIMB 9791 / VKM B-1370 / CB 48) TaxID=573065 RepID=E8RV01_ASTEC|nr:glyoxylate/hydroxypyruvate reductase A [Asticcacaulis excentricus]ADU14201.1 D-isomer specific 2-hydroxyacid dehydrogenase NAD-binding protein [Asticcacaulis excentricus CB 48]
MSSVVTSPIVFTGRVCDAEARVWIAALSAALPDTPVVPLSDADPQAVEVAVVANPDPALLHTLPRLKWVHSVWAGVERLVAELPADLPIVRLVDPELSRVMGEAVLAWTLYLQRDMPAYARQQAARQWHQRPYRAPSEMTVGVLGLGHMGRTAVARLREAGFRVLGWSRTLKTADFEVFTGMDGLKSVMSRADIVISLLPSTPDTRRILNTETLGWLPPGAALINFGRGAALDIDALLQALDHTLSHAVLDVFESEPLEAASPLWNHPQVTVLPHISAPTNVNTAAQVVAENLRLWRMTGQLPPTVERLHGY